MKDTIIIERERVNEYVDYINKKQIKRAYTEDMISKIDFLTNCPHIEYLNLLSPFIKDFSPLYDLKNLKVLYLYEPAGPVDMAHLTGLKAFSTIGFKRIKNLGKCTSLEDLNISNFSPKSKNCEDLSSLENLKTLYIVRSTIDSFKGLGNLKKLKKMDLYSLYNLRYIDELEKISDNLIILRFESCKNIQNFEYVTHLKELGLLAFGKCGSIPSIGFIKHIPKLKAFIFVDTDVLDGDLTPCVGLEYVAFNDKKHYSHKFKNFKNEWSSYTNYLFRYDNFERNF